MDGRQWNKLIYMVNERIPKAEAGELTEEETKAYDNMWAQAIEIENKYGSWPVFDCVEVD